MKKTKIGAILLTVALLTVSAIAVGEEQEDDNDMDMHIYGGIGVHFEIKNKTPEGKSVKYSIVRGTLVEDAEVLVSSGNTVIQSVYPLSLISKITASMSTEGKQMTKTGMIIGVFVIFTGEI